MQMALDEIESLKEAKMSLLGERDRISSGFDDVKEELRVLDVQRAEELAIVEAEKARLSEVMVAGARRCDDLQKYVKVLETQIETLGSQHSDAKAEIDLQRDKLVEQSKNLSDLSRSLTDAAAARDVLQREGAGLQEKCNQLRRHCGDLEEAHQLSNDSWCALQAKAARCIHEMKE